MLEILIQYFDKEWCLFSPALVSAWARLCRQHGFSLDETLDPGARRIEAFCERAGAHLQRFEKQFTEHFAGTNRVAYRIHATTIPRPSEQIKNFVVHSQPFCVRMQPVEVAGAPCGRRAGLQGSSLRNVDSRNKARWRQPKPKDLKITNSRNKPRSQRTPKIRFPKTKPDCQEHRKPVLPKQSHMVSPEGRRPENRQFPKQSQSGCASQEKRQNPFSQNKARSGKQSKNRIPETNPDRNEHRKPVFPKQSQIARTGVKICRSTGHGKDVAPNCERKFNQ